MYVESHSHAFSGGNFSGAAQLGSSQPRHCLGLVVVVRLEGGSRRSVAPYTTQLENDALWHNWLNVKQDAKDFFLKAGPEDTVTKTSST